MSDWLLNLPVMWMAVVIFAATYLLAASIYWVVTTLAVNDRARAFKAVSPGMLPPLGILFALLVGFIALLHGRQLHEDAQPDQPGPGIQGQV